MKIYLTVERIEAEQVILKDASGRLINWPLDLLSGNVKEKEQILFSIGEEENSAKDILNEILG
jgi:hypothetical protein